MGSTGRSNFLGVYALVAFFSACGGQATGRSGVADGTPRTRADGGTGVAGSGSVDGGADAGRPPRLTVRLNGFGNVQIRDEQKGIDCQPTSADDGTERCLPIGGHVLFTDSGCTVPVIFPTSDPCSVAPTYATHYGGPAGCTVRKSATFSLGSAIETPSALYNQGLGGCFVVKDTERSSFGLVDGTFYEAVPMSAADWVKLTKETVPVTDALAVTSWKGADGSVIPDGLELRASGTPCAPYPPYARAGTEQRCVPTARAEVSDVYADGTCEGARLATSCTPAEVIDLGSEIDGSGNLVDHLSETVSAGSTGYFINPFADNVCQKFPASPSDAPYLYTAGPPLAVNRYPLLAEAVEGTERLQTRYLTSDGKNLLAESLYDSAYGETCAPMQLSDGARWCVPSSTVRFVYYGDAGCTVPIGIDESDVPNPRWGILNPGKGPCSESTPPALYAAVPATGSDRYLMQYPDNGPAQCELLDSGPNSARSYGPGPSLEPSTVFAAAPPNP